MVIAPLPNPLFVQIDKDDQSWRLRYSLDDVELQVRISHVGLEDPDNCVGEIRPKDAADFVHVGTFWIAPIEHTSEWPDPPNVDEFPVCWRPEFLMLIRLWSELTALTLLAATFGQAVPEDVR